ncbi:helix-turn-helix domain-containing protein [Terribacillus saccharophilus]|uniref:helix-turn-helix transcriptional regulator n=1 Tax=Terribacillus saccharophilus TaxID=361277 RepID=UPI00398203CD
MNKNYEDYPIILSAEDVADILKVSKSTAYALMNAPDFPLIKLNGTYRVKRVLKDKFIEYIS